MFDSGRPQETKVTLSHSVFITGRERITWWKVPVLSTHVRIQQAYRIHACWGGIYPVYNVIANMFFFFTDLQILLIFFKIVLQTSVFRIIPKPLSQVLLRPLHLSTWEPFNDLKNLGNNSLSYFARVLPILIWLGYNHRLPTVVSKLCPYLHIN